jgi:uncharacterized Zn finger protein (UPF0148 family)
MLFTPKKLCPKCRVGLVLVMGPVACGVCGQRDMPSFKLESGPVTQFVAHFPDRQETEIERQLRMRPVAAITTSSWITPGTGSLTLG